MNKLYYKIFAFFIFFILLLSEACSEGGKKNTSIASMAQTKKIKHGELTLEFLPGKKHIGDISHVINIRLTLYSDTLVKGNAFMQYMNFNINRQIFGIYGKDTVQASFCERIPGINEKQFQYILALPPPKDFESMQLAFTICFNDTTGLWGNQQFEISGDVLSDYGSKN
jgi:hypothetical protein